MHTAIGNPSLVIWGPRGLANGLRSLNTSGKKSNWALEMWPFKKKQNLKTRRIEPTLNSTAEIDQAALSANAVMQVILGTEKLSKPVFVPWLNSKEDCNDAVDSLPLIYIWNERQIGHDLHYEVSINSPIVAGMLESSLSRSDPNFEQTRDRIVNDLAKISVQSIQDACAEIDLSPSIVFASTEGRD